MYVLTRTQPFSGDFALCDQIRRAAISIVSNIAEGFERGTPKDFIHFLHIARGATGEVKTQLIVAFDLGYLAKDQLDKAMQDCCDILHMITGLIAYLNTCGPQKTFSEKWPSAAGVVP